MNFNFRKRFFVRGDVKLKTTVSLPETMFDGLKFISDQTGNSIPEIIIDALDQYLTHLAENKAIPFPKEIADEKESA